MNREEVIRLAKEAGLQPYYDAQSLAIERFAALVAKVEREKEREACVEICDGYAQARFAAKAIRARGESK